MSELDMPDSPNGGYRPLTKREFIVELADDTDRTLFIVRPEDVREAIVRCKDCKHFTIVDETPDMEYPIRGCWLLTWRYEDEEPQDEYGYCAWGEVRDGA